MASRGRRRPWQGEEDARERWEELDWGGASTREIWLGAVRAGAPWELGSLQAGGARALWRWAHGAQGKNSAMDVDDGWRG
jgi:hypothetical protein